MTLREILEAKIDELHATIALLEQLGVLDQEPDQAHQTLGREIRDADIALPARAQRRSRPAQIQAATWNCPPGVEQETWDNWMLFRGSEKAPVSARVYEGILLELEAFEKRGFPAEQIVKHCLDRGLIGLFRPPGSITGFTLGE